jgi:hypothetical protein
VPLTGARGWQGDEQYWRESLSPAPQDLGENYQGYNFSVRIARIKSMGTWLRVLPLITSTSWNDTVQLQVILPVTHPWSSRV